MAAVALALLAASCASLPPSLRSQPEDRALLRRVARLARPTGARFGISALHVESGRRLSWNGGDPFEAASVIKLALLVEAAARVAEGTLDLGSRWTVTREAKAAPSSLLLEFDDGLAPTERDLLHLMIGRSDNTATNRFIDLFGAEATNRRMEALGFPRIRLLGRIPDRDPEETQGERWRGLVLGSMTPDDTVELYRRLTTGTLLGGAADALAMDVLASQHLTERIPRLLLANGAKWAGKTGTLRARRNDSGILTTPRGRFVLVMFAERIPETPGAAYRVNQTMGEIAKAIVETWSRP